MKMHAPRRVKLYCRYMDEDHVFVYSRAERMYICTEDKTQVHPAMLMTVYSTEDDWVEAPVVQLPEHRRAG